MQQSHASSIPPNYGRTYHNSQNGSARQLELFPLSNKRQKPQISTIPGVPVSEIRRYRIVCGDKILRDRLTLDEVLAAMGGKN